MRRTKQIEWLIYKLKRHERRGELAVLEPSPPAGMTSEKTICELWCAIKGCGVFHVLLEVCGVGEHVWKD